MKYLNIRGKTFYLIWAILINIKSYKSVANALEVYLLQQIEIAEYSN